MLRKLLVLLAALLTIQPLWANPGSAVWVRDSADVLGPTNRSHLENILEQVKQQTSAEVMVITVPSLNGQDVDSFATQMFNQIGIGRSDTHNGVLFLIAPNERRTRIEVGYGLEALITDDLAGRILDSYVIPHFRNGDMEAGVVAGTEAIVQVLQGNPEAARGVVGAAPVYVGTPLDNLKNAFYGAGGLGVLQFVLYFLIRRRQRFPTVLMYLIGALSLGAVGIAAFAWFYLGAFDTVPLPQAIGGSGSLLGSLILNARLYRRYRPRSCTHCSGPLQVLSETQDDVHLDEVQKLEEKLGSVDYDVWFCPACLKSDTERYVETFSNYSDCPKCQARTLKETRTTLVAATTSHGGKERIDTKCAHCGHADSRVRSTPRISSSSGSGGSRGGSSGGGRSGGGGASRSW